MKYAVKRGSTANWFRVKLKQDGSAAAGSQGKGKTGLTISSSGLIISTIADNEASATVYTAAGSTIETITTLGTFATPTATKCRFKEVDATNHPGLYEIQLADARYAVSSSKKLYVSISGVTGVMDCDVEIQLTAVDVDSAATFMTGVNGVAPPTNWNLESIDGSGRVDVGKISGSTTPTTLDSNQALTVNTKYLNSTSLTARDIGASVLISAGTGTGQLDVTSGVIKANLVQILATALTETAGQIAAAFKKFFNIATPAATMDHLILVDTVTTYTGNTPQTGDSFAIVNSGTFGNAQLVRSTTPANTLDVSATGEAGLDFNNVKDATGAHTLTNIRIPNVTLVDTVTTYTGNTPQTGDAFAVVNDAAFGNAKLVRSTTPGNTLSVDANHRMDLGSWLGQAVTFDANNVPNVSAKYWAGQLIPTPALTGVPKVDVRDWIGSPVALSVAGFPVVTVNDLATQAQADVLNGLTGGTNTIAVDSLHRVKGLDSGGNTFTYVTPDNAVILIAATNAAALVQMTSGTGTARLFTVNALSNAPAGGGGGGGTTVNEDNDVTEETTIVT